MVRDGARVHVIPLASSTTPRPRTITWPCQRRQALSQAADHRQLEAALDPARFVRIHRSAIVNLERVTRIEPYGKESRLAILADGARLPVSRAGYARLLEAMDASHR